MRRLSGWVAVALVGLLLAVPAEAQGRFWVLVNGALRYTGSVVIQGATAALTIGSADTSGVRLDLESGDLAVREGDDSAYANLNVGTFVRFGGTTSSFPALKRSSSALEVRLADDSAYAGFNASVLGIGASGGGFNLAERFATRTAPTISSGFGTSPSIVVSNGTLAFTVNVGTGGSASGGVIAMPSAATGWLCHVNNLTAAAANRANQRTLQTAATTTSVSVQNQLVSTGAAQAWTASDVLQLICVGY